MSDTDYSDIIDLPHHVSKKHPPMSMEMRAAQFSPFAALTGYDEIIDAASGEHEDMVKREISLERIEEA